MKKLSLSLAIMLCCCMNVFSQATSLTIDCQNPGWLSTMINYGDQQTLKNLKVTGYINGTDIKFIRELNLNQNLTEVLDLEDVHIVSGGNPYGSFSDNYNPITEDNTITEYMFSDLKPMKKVILPQSITSWDGRYQFLKTKVDTLVINGSMKDINIGGGIGNNFWKVRCIFFPEGIQNIDFNYYFHQNTNLSNIELFLPSTLAIVRGSSACADETTVFHCSSLRPDTIQVVGYINNHFSFFNNGTIYVPKGTKDLYKQSIFSKLNIIEDIHVESISITDKQILYVEDNIELNANIYPEDAIDQSVIWTTSNPEVAEIEESGIIHAKAYGSAIITATTVDGGYKASCTVNVYDHTTGISMINSISIPIDDTYTLNAQTLPLNTSDNILTYTSENGDIASVNSQGIVTAKKKGTCIITATSVDGGYTATCEVTVTQPVETIALDKHNMTIKVGETDKLFAQISPATANNKEIEWSSSNKKVATVDNNGGVTALKAGEAWIKVISKDNAEAKDSCKVIVTQPATGITLSQESCRLTKIGETIQLEATVLPEDASNKEVKWTSSNEAVCIVANGKVVATGFGTAVVIATTIDGSFMATCTVLVEKGTVPVTEIVLSQTSVELSKGETFQLTATVLPTDATNKTLTWKSSDESVCVTTQTGTLIAMNDGIAIITVTSENGSVQAHCNVKVVNSDGIDDIIVDSKEILYIQMNGMYTSGLKQGLNIIRMKDGTTRKIFMK